jgi:hypothetical protein
VKYSNIFLAKRDFPDKPVPKTRSSASRRKKIPSGSWSKIAKEESRIKGAKSHSSQGFCATKREHGGVYAIICWNWQGLPLGSPVCSPKICKNLAKSHAKHGLGRNYRYGESCGSLQWGGDGTLHSL